METDNKIKNYEITMLTFEEKVPVGPNKAYKYAPWYTSYNAGSFILSNAKESTIVISDDDDRFQANYPEMPSTENLQQVQSDLNRLHPDIAADGILPENVKLKSFVGSILQSDSTNSDKPDQFMAMFPALLDENNPRSPVYFGDGKSVLIIPLAKEDGTFPQFDKTHTFHFVEYVPYENKIENQPKYASIYQPKDESSDVPCFGEGTLIRTSKGELPVETLQCGDLVETLDHGLRRIHWIGSKAVDADRFVTQPHLKPILVRTGALGPDTPDRDLLLSPQHRVLLRNSLAKELFGESELLVAAKHLVSLPGIRVATPRNGLTYWHILFDRHQVVMSNGAWTESFFTGPYAMRCLSEEARREILDLFPQIATPAFRPRPARPLIRAKDVRILLRKHHNRDRAGQRHRTVNFRLQSPTAA